MRRRGLPRGLSASNSTQHGLCTGQVACDLDNLINPPIISRTADHGAAAVPRPQSAMSFALAERRAAHACAGSSHRSVVGAGPAIHRPRAGSRAPRRLDACRATGSGTGIVIVDHGSRRKASNDMLLDFVELFRRSTDHAVVEPAHMELAEPSIQQAIGGWGRGPRCAGGRARARGAHAAGDPSPACLAMHPVRPRARPQASVWSRACPAWWWPPTSCPMAATYKTTSPPW